MSLKEINSEIIFLTKLFSYMLLNTKVFKNEWQILVTWYQRKSYYSHNYIIFFFPLIMHFLKSTQFMIFAFGVQLGRTYQNIFKGVNELYFIEAEFKQQLTI